MSTTQSYNEKELLRKVAAGDHDAFAELVTLYKETVYASAFRLLQDSQRAEDSFQDIFMKVWLNRTALSEINNFGAWLNTVTQNTLFSAIKRLAREKIRHNEVQKLGREEVTVEDLLANKENNLLLQRAVNALPERQREVYHLIKEMELKGEEVATRLDISLATVKFHLGQAVRNIRSFVLKYGEFMLIFFICIIKE